MKILEYCNRVEQFMYNELFYYGRNTIPVDDDLETVSERRERWRSIYAIYFTMFLMSLGFSIILTGVWPFLDKVNKSMDCTRVI